MASKSRKIISPFSDLLAHLHAIEEIDDVQLRAGREYQQDWRCKSNVEVGRVHGEINSSGQRLLMLVLVLGKSPADVAPTFGWKDHQSVRTALIDCLNIIAMVKGYRNDPSLKMAWFKLDGYCPTDDFLSADQERAALDYAYARATRDAERIYTDRKAQKSAQNLRYRRKRELALEAARRAAAQIRQ